MSQLKLNLVQDEIMHIVEKSMHDFVNEDGGFDCDMCSREKHSVLHFNDNSSKRNQQGDFAESLDMALTHFNDWNS